MVQLKALFAGETAYLPINERYDLSAVEFSGYFPFRQPVRITGGIRERARMVILEGRIAFTFEGICDRCAAAYVREQELPVSHVLVTSLNDEESADADELILCRDEQLDLRALTEADLLLCLPTKNLCTPNCAGLCPRCGQNLNDDICGCSPG
ncbi:MAG: DUF177 domain-containing protein [Oscillospiraceae bacterium]|nr:DUF177 domain-containing protein [Oscillospiraceae bacterium]